MTRKIIVGFDPEHDSSDALQLGRVLSEALEAQPVVVSALPWPTYLLSDEPTLARIQNEMAESLAATEVQLRDLGAVTRALPSASPALTLQEEAEREGAGLIVISSCHRGPVQRTLAGSVGESLLQGASCAVAVANRGFADTQRQIQTVGVAFDGSPEAWTAVESGIGFCERTNGKLTVIAVADHTHYGYATSWSIMLTGEFRDAEREEKQRLVELAEKRAPYGTRLRTRVETGNAGSVLAEISADYDLMIAGSRSYGPLRRTLLGSTTRRLIRSASCPVLVLPRGAGVDPLAIREAT